MAEAGVIGGAAGGSLRGLIGGMMTRVRGFWFTGEDIDGDADAGRWNTRGRLGLLIACTDCLHALRISLI
jgi:hypothetical protein